MRHCHLPNGWIAIGFSTLWLLTSCGEGPTEVSGRRPQAAKAPAGVTVTAATPDIGIQGTTLDVQVTGSGFDRGSRVDFTRDGVIDSKLHVNTTTYRTTGELVANVSIAADAVATRYDVAVTTSTGKKGIGTERFAVAVPYERLSMSTALSSGVTSVSANGWMSGALDFNDPCPPYMQPVVWSPSGTLIRLPLPNGRCAGKPRGVNRNGVVVGTAYTTSSDRVSVRWTPEGSGYVALQLPSLAGGNEAGARAVATDGTISATEDPAVWTEAGGWQVSQVPAGYLTCGATMLNDAGQLAATCMNASLANHIFVWASSAAAPVEVALPAGTTAGIANGFSATRTVVGYVRTTSSSQALPVRWLPTGGGWTAELLPHLGQGGVAWGVNGAGFVVGSVANKDGTGRPVYWTPAGTLRLLGTTSRGEGVAYGISDGTSGFVIGGNVRTGRSVTDFFAARWRP